VESGFHAEPRGAIRVRGYGSMDAYLVERRRDGAAAA
jgi:hypothetical protein